jgi:hypothetical protein
MQENWRERERKEEVSGELFHETEMKCGEEKWVQGCDAEATPELQGRLWAGASSAAAPGLKKYGQIPYYLLKMFELYQPHQNFEISFLIHPLPSNLRLNGVK